MFRHEGIRLQYPRAQSQPWSVMCAHFCCVDVAFLFMLAFAAVADASHIVGDMNPWREAVAKSV